jgi:hypothetical protein
MKAVSIRIGGVIFSLVFAAALMMTALSGCENLFKDNTDNETPQEDPGEEAPPDFSFVSIALAEDEAVAGKKAGSFTGQAALTYTMTGGEGGADNGSFEIRGTDVFIKTALSAGAYRFRVRGADSAGKAQEKSFTYTVTALSSLAAPGALKTVPGIRTVSVRWGAVEGAVSYAVFYATGAQAALVSAVQFGEDIETTSVTITGLADSTVYTVWVRTKDSGGKYSAYSAPSVCRKTSDPVNPFWYTGDFDSWESGYDGYAITATTLNYNTMAPWDEHSEFKYMADIRYYVEFDPAEAAEKAPKTQKGKFQESLAGHPAGVFIIEYREDCKPEGRPGDFFGVYFYGLGAVQTNNSTMWTTQHHNDRLAYLGNSYGLSEQQGGPDGAQEWDPEAETLEAAIERFTLDNIGQFIAYAATPWYRLKGTFTDNNQNDEQWVKGGGYP